VVTVALDASLQSEVKVGERATITHIPPHRRKDCVELMHRPEAAAATDWARALQATTEGAV
jgi:hypothetical protein